MNYQKKLLSMGFVKNDDGDFEFNVLDINITLSVFWSEHYSPHYSFVLWVYNYATELETRKVYKTFSSVIRQINKILYT
jgi:hypothetical protein